MSFLFKRTLKPCCATSLNTNKKQSYRCRATSRDAIFLLCVNTPYAWETNAWSVKQQESNRLSRLSDWRHH
jgi:peroxiredoxin